ncbi:putative ribonuclease H-like domain-containing protein [Tanacetum coccineum]
MNIKFRGGLLGLKRLHGFLEVTTAHVHNGNYAKGPRNQESRHRNQDSSRRTVNVEDTSSKAMVAIDGAGLDWSFMVEEEVTTNMALMAFSDSEEFQQPEFEGYGPKSICVDTSNEVKKTSDTPLVEELVSEKEKPKAVNTARLNSTIVNAVRDNQANVVKTSACWGIPPTDDQGYVDSGCSRHMTGNISYLSYFQEFDRGYVTFGGGVRGGKITGKGTLKMGKLDFQDVFFVKELQFNLFSVTQMCDKKNGVLFTDTACFILSPDFKLPDESQILHKIPRKNNMYSVDMKNIVPKESLTFLVTKATLDESMLWHRRLGHVNIKTINKLVKDNLVRGLPSKLFENDQTCVACLKGKQHKASCIKREYSVARTPQQNGVAERRNKTLIKAAKTMLADSKLPTTFWAEAVNIACYVQNRVLIVKPHNKTPYELFRGRTPSLSIMRPFGCHVTILNTLDHLGKFDGKFDDGFFVGYLLTSKAFRVYNIRTRKVEENLHIRFLEDKPIVSGDGLKWLFDIDSLTKSINYVPVIAGTNSKDFAGSEVSIGEGTTSKETNTSQDFIVMPLWKDSSLFDSPSINVSHDEPEPSCDAKKRMIKGTGSLHINTVSPTVLTTRSNRPQTVSGIFLLKENVTPEATNVDLFGGETEMDMSNLNASYQVPTTPNTRIHKDHSLDHVIGDIQSGVQTRGMTKTANEQRLLSVAYERKPHEDLNTCLFFCFLSQEETKRVTKALSDSAWVEAMQEELLQFKLQKIEEEVYVCQPPWFEDPDYPNKVYKVVKALYGLHQAPRAWYETLAKYLLDNGFHRGKIDQTLFIKKQKWDILLLHMSSMGELTFFLGLQVKQKEDGIFISQDKYVTDILKKFGFQDVRTASTPMDTEKPLLKDSDGDDVDVHLYRSMIGSLMYLTSSRPDIMFAVCACARFQVTPKVSHSHAIKRIFRYLKGKPKLGLWYPRDSPFDLVAYSDSDYAGASIDMISLVGDEVVHKELGDRMERVAITSSSLEVEQDSGNINRTQSMATLNETSL